MTRARILLVIAAAAALLAAGGCRRPGIEEPSPFGPASFGLSLELSARPNVILATEARPTAEIRATIRQNGRPVKDRLVYFTILSGPGQFGDFSIRTAVLTDASGVALVLFIGPTKYEILDDLQTTIRGHMETSTPDFIHREVDVRILKSLT